MSRAESDPGIFGFLRQIRSLKRTQILFQVEYSDPLHDTACEHIDQRVSDRAEHDDCRRDKSIGREPQDKAHNHFFCNCETTQRCFPVSLIPHVGHLLFLPRFSFLYATSPGQKISDILLGKSLPFAPEIRRLPANAR